MKNSKKLWILVISTVLCFSGFSCLSEKNDSQLFKNFSFPNVLASGVTGLNGTPIIITSGGVFKGDSDELSNLKFSKMNGFGDGEINCGTISYNDFWVGTSDGLYDQPEMNLSNKPYLYTTADGLPSNNIEGVFTDNVNTLLVLTDDGLAEEETNGFDVSFKKVTNSNLPDYNDISTIYIEDVGIVGEWNIFIGTKSDGLYVLTATTDGTTLDTHLTSDNSALSGSITALVTSNDGYSLFVGTNNSGLFKFKLDSGDSSATISYDGNANTSNSKLPSNNITSLSTYDDNFLVGTQSGMCWENNSWNNFVVATTANTNLISNSITSTNPFASSLSSDLLIIGTNMGVSIIDGNLPTSINNPTTSKNSNKSSSAIIIIFLAVLIFLGILVFIFSRNYKNKLKPKS